MWPLNRSSDQSRKKQVLIVDDDPGERTMLKEFFELEGYEVLQLSGGGPAAETAAKYLPDLITMDMRMPGAPGLEAVRAIRSNPKTKQIPILMCTGENKVEDIDQSLKAGANDYIPKPINLARLKAKCAKLLGLEL